MARKGGKTKGSKGSGMVSPLYSKPDGMELGPHRVEGPHGGMSVPDPVGFGHGKLATGPSSQDRKQVYQKD